MSTVKIRAFNALKDIAEAIDKLLEELTDDEQAEGRTSKKVNRQLKTLTQVERSDSLLCELAKREFTNRRMRSAHFDQDLFGEAAWDIILDAFITRASGQRACIKASCLAASVPATTALRYVKLLVARGVLEEQPSASDKRIKWLCLSDDHYVRLAAYLNAIYLSEVSSAAKRENGSEYLVKPV